MQVCFLSIPDSKSIMAFQKFTKHEHMLLETETKRKERVKSAKDSLLVQINYKKITKVIGQQRIFKRQFFELNIEFFTGLCLKRNFLYLSVLNFPTHLKKYLLHFFSEFAFM